ncbi:MAG: dehypoxanthine futalosine cyclase [Bacteroidales bacterium]|nr:dehypoxanthine futalosine cyclase [Bacteroidales bacterium]
MWSRKQIVEKALAMEFLDGRDGFLLFIDFPLSGLIALGHALRMKRHPAKVVSWIIDRNVNITNICLSGCKFCNFYRTAGSDDAYVTTLHEYIQKINEMQKLGGNQLLLQGGMHPKLGLDFYLQLFRDLKRHYPALRLHALGPPEIVHLARMEKLSYKEVLERLVEAGLSSLPGAGAEILVDRVRKELSPAKCTTTEWLEVMRAAHELNLTTSATMMFGHIETIEERLEHLIALRTLQSEKPAGHKGFLNFVPWPFQDENTQLRKKSGVTNNVTPEEYLRMIAISRIMLPNIPNIQASWLTVGKETGQLALHAGANDFGSIMIEENVVSVAGAFHTFDAEGIRQAIREAGFTPVQRDQDFVLTETSEYCS